MRISSKLMDKYLEASKPKSIQVSPLPRVIAVYLLESSPYLYGHSSPFQMAYIPPVFLEELREINLFHDESGRYH